MQALAKRLTGQTGQPFLVIIEHDEQLVHYALAPPPGHRHPFDGTYTVREFAFGVLSGEALFNDPKNHPAALGLPCGQHSTKRENYDDEKMVPGAFWISASGSRLTTWFDNRVNVLIGAEEISRWVKEEVDLWETDGRLMNLCALANTLRVDLKTWKAIRSHILHKATLLLAEVETKYIALQQGAIKVLQEATTNGPLKTLANSYGNAIKRLQLLTGEPQKEPVTFPPYRS